MSCYIDLYTEPADLDEAVDIIKHAKRLGYCIIGMKPSEEDAWNRILDEGSRVGIRIVRVAGIKGVNRSDLARKAVRVPKNTILLVKATSQESVRYASISKKYAGYIVTPGLERLVDRSTRNLFRERGWGIVVVVLRHLLEKRSRAIWRYYYLSLRKGFANSIDIALASGARYSEELWHPMSAAGVASIVGIPGEYALLWLTSAPAKIIDVFSR